MVSSKHLYWKPGSSSMLVWAYLPPPHEYLPSQQPSPDRRSAALGIMDLSDRSHYFPITNSTPGSSLYHMYWQVSHISECGHYLRLAYVPSCMYSAEDHNKIVGKHLTSASKHGQSEKRIPKRGFQASSWEPDRCGGSVTRYYWVDYGFGNCPGGFQSLLGMDMCLWECRNFATTMCLFRNIEYARSRFVCTYIISLVSYEWWQDESRYEMRLMLDAFRVCIYDE